MEVESTFFKIEFVVKSLKEDQFFLHKNMFINNYLVSKFIVKHQISLLLSGYDNIVHLGFENEY